MKSTYLDNVFLSIILLNTPFTPPATVYLALYTVLPGVGGGGTEVSGGSYGRQAVTFTAPPVSGQTSNVADILFPVATANWGTIVGFALLDAPVGGNLLYFGNLSIARTILTSDQVKFPAGQLIATET